MSFHFKSLVVIAFLLINSIPANAAVTFLPDYEEGKFKFEDGINQDDQLCHRAKDDSGNALYHHAPGAEPKCPGNQVYDNHCPHGDNGKDWITKCHCPNGWVQCSSPMVGKGAQCTESSGSRFYASCCNPSCRYGGSTSGCYGSEVVDSSYENDCNETCYTCRIKNTCTTSCYSDEISSPSGGTNDDNGQPCVQCDPKPAPEEPVTPEPTPDDPVIPGPDDPCSGVSCSNGEKCQNGSCVCPAGQCCPSCGKGYACKSGTCQELPPDDPCASVTCSDGKQCKDGSCVCPAGKCCPDCSGSQVCDKGSCRDKTCAEKNLKDCGGRCASCCSNSDCPSGKECTNGSCTTPVCKYEDKCSGYTLSSDSSCPCHGRSCSNCGITKYMCLPKCKLPYICDFTSADCYIRPYKMLMQRDNPHCGKCECAPGDCVGTNGRPCQCMII